MSMSFFSPSLATNISWTGAYSALDPNNLANVSNQNKALYLNASNNLALGANGANQPIMADAMGLVPVSNLPSYVSGIIEYPTFADFPPQPNPALDTIYVSMDNLFSYRSTGTVYIQVTDSRYLLASGTTVDLNMNAQDITNVDAITTNTLNATNIGAHNVTGAINMNTNNITNGGIINCTNVNSTSLSSNGYYNSSGDQFIAFSTEIEALKNLDMNNNNISNVGTLTATTSNLGTLGSNVNLGTKNLSNGGVVTCTNITCPDIATTRLYDIGGVQYGSLATNTLTMIKPIAMSTNNISGIGTLSATTSNLGTLGSDVNLGAKNLSNGGIVTCTNMNSPNIATTTLYDIGGTPYGSLASDTLTLVKPIAMSSNNISGVGTISGTTANFTNVTGITSLSSTNATVTNNLTISNSITGTGGSAYLQGQGILYYNIPSGVSGVVVQNLATLPAFCTSVQYISSVLVCQSDNLGGNYTVIPEYGTFQGSTRQWWSWSYDVTTRLLTVTFTDIGQHGHFFDAFGIISMKVIFNVS